MVTNTVDRAAAAVIVPESAAGEYCTVAPIAPSAVRIHIIVKVIRGEHHSILITLMTERIANVTRVPSSHHPVVGCLAEYNERTVLGIVPAEIT